MSARADRATAHAADLDEARDVRYANPFAPPDELDPDGESRPHSLFGEILDWMLAPLLLFWPMSIAVTYLVAKSIANGRSTARSKPTPTCSRGRSIRSTAWRNCRCPMPRATFCAPTTSTACFIQVLGTRGELVSGERDMPLPPEDDRPQPGIVEFRDDVCAATISASPQTVEFPQTPGARPALVQVAETLEKRCQLANEIIKGVILPQFVILPVAVLLVWFGLLRGLVPLSRLQEHIRARRPDDLRPIEARRAPRKSRRWSVVQRPADAPRTEHGAAKALYRRCRASDENAAGRPAHPGRTGVASGRVRRKCTARSNRSPPVRNTPRGSSRNCWRWRARKTGMSGQIFTPVEDDRGRAASPCATGCRPRSPSRWISATKRLTSPSKSTAIR